MAPGRIRFTIKNAVLTRNTNALGNMVTLIVG